MFIRLMFTLITKEMYLVISLMIPILSNPLIDSLTRNEVWADSSHSGTTILSPCFAATSFATGQLFLWTVTLPSGPRNPTTLSPGIGLQHCAMTYLWLVPPASLMTKSPPFLPLFLNHASHCLGPDELSLLLTILSRSLIFTRPMPILKYSSSGSSSSTPYLSISFLTILSVILYPRADSWSSSIFLPVFMLSFLSPLR